MRFDRLVQRAAPAPAAQHQQYGSVSRKSVPPPRRLPVAAKELAPHGAAHAYAVGEAGGSLGKARQNTAAALCNDAGAQPGGKIALVREHGDMQFARRPYGGIARIPALGKDEVGLFALHHGERLFLRFAQGKGEREIFRRERPYELGAIHRKIRASEGADERPLDALRSHVGKAVSVLQDLHHGEVGRHVPRAPAARKHQVFHLHSICRPRVFIERAPLAATKNGRICARSLHFYAKIRSFKKLAPMRTARKVKLMSEKSPK